MSLYADQDSSLQHLVKSDAKDSINRPSQPSVLLVACRTAQRSEVERSHRYRVANQYTAQTYSNHDSDDSIVWRVWAVLAVWEVCFF